MPLNDWPSFKASFRLKPQISRSRESPLSPTKTFLSSTPRRLPRNDRIRTADGEKNQNREKFD